MKIKTELPHHNKDKLSNKTNKPKEFVLSEKELFETANLHPIDTGLPTTLYTLFNGINAINQQIPIIIIETSIGQLSIIIEDKIKLRKKYNLSTEDQIKVNEAIKYIEQHKQTFIDHWNGLITDKGLIDELFNSKIAKRIN